MFFVFDFQIHNQYTMATNSRGDWRTVNCYLHVKNQQTNPVTFAHLLTWVTPTPPNANGSPERLHSRSNKVLQAWHAPKLDPIVMTFC